MTRVILTLDVFLAVLSGVGCAASRLPAQQSVAPLCRCTPDRPCWPTEAEWRGLGMSLHGKLEQPQAIRNSKNPFYLQDQPGGTQSTGWLGAWDAASSAYAVAAEDAADIVAAVNFARQHKLRLV